MTRWLDHTWVIQGNIHLLGDLAGALFIAVFTLGSKPQHRRMVLWPLLMLGGYSSIPYVVHAPTPWAMIYHAFFVATAVWATVMLIDDLPTYTKWWLGEFRLGWREGWTRNSMRREHLRAMKAKTAELKAENAALEADLAQRRAEADAGSEKLMQRLRELDEVKRGVRVFDFSNGVFDDEGYPITRLKDAYPRVSGHEEIL